MLEGDAPGSAWSERSIHEADRIVVVARASGDPSPGPSERSLFDGEDAALSAGVMLVLTHPEGTAQPTATHRWLDSRPVASHHHVRDGHVADVERVARYIAGEAIGVALGGGGARGFAHIGVLRALAEAGVTVDAISGTSMGALVAAEHALGWDAAKILETNTRLFSGWQSDVTLPIVSLLGGHRSGRRIATYIPDASIEDMWLPFSCISSNLSRAEMVVHRRGSLRTALRASAGVPGILPPVVENGDLLVDGAMMRNLPADVVARQLGGGKVIAVDVSAPIDLTGNVSWSTAVSGWGIVWSRMNPFRRAIAAPHIAAILQRAGEVASRAEERRIIRELDGLYMRVPVEGYGLLDFSAAQGLVETGYRYASEQLESWLEESEA